MVLVIESHIIDYQLDYSVDENEYPGQVVPDYEFNHLLRDAVNGALGVPITTDAQEGFRRTMSYSYDFNIDEWDLHNRSIVAFVYDTGNGRVLNVNSSYLHE